jgi:Tfp pilus assembly protein PilF
MPDDLTSRGIAALKAGDRLRARQLLAAAVTANPNDEQAWLWLSGAVDAGHAASCSTWRRSNQNIRLRAS